ncbi:thioredoxin family protein [Oleiagrimonas soli]|uniref:Thiol-disulfide isomerase/thioredoxin n=1 Tax=Oleiagrimonas soli TaxID=1543381 RepID=A0A841KCE7_9GAMM|nr:thioredoxin family protein [Oleiagrimonas soli]MBB6182852.1 thiol-disulfide isomerase/thioredoxin [Oleiagrimonas soli]
MRFRTPLALLFGACIALTGLLPAARAQVPAQAPAFAGIDHWINSKPLTMQQLRGKVVLIDFWTYSCINCLRTLPHLKSWWAKYKDKGLVIVGVHSPEFDFEKNTANVEAAVKKYGIGWPVAQDNDMATWNAWNNQYWPAEYLIDKNGKVVMHHFGEGHYMETENAIRQLLGLPAMTREDVAAADLSKIGSPEMYLGSNRVRNMANPIPPLMFSHDYTAPARLPLNKYALEGRWRMSGEYAELTGDKGQIRLHFQSGKLHMVASSKDPVTLSITVDGKKQPDVTVHGSRLYTLFDSNDYRDHVITIDVPTSGFRAFTFTFG